MSQNNFKDNDSNKSKDEISDDNSVKITVCFCDENCSVYNLLKNENGWNCEKNVKAKEFNKERLKTTETDLVKKKIVDCRQVRIPASINILSNNKESKQYQNIVKRYKNSNKNQQNGRKKTYKGANGLQDGKDCQTPSSNSSSLFNNHIINPDIAVCVNGIEFKCSGDLLKSYSSFFRELQINKNFMVYLCGICISQETFSIMYTWMQMYVKDSTRTVNENNIVDVLSACQFLGVDQLEIICWQLICDQSTFVGERSFKIYRIATEKHFDQVTSTVFDRVVDYFPVLMNTKEFLEMEVYQLCPILDSDELQVCSEMEVFLSACKWIMYDLDSRLDKLNQIIDCVRFGLMSPEQLCILHLLEIGDNLKIVASHPYTARKIENGIVLNSLKNEFNYPNVDSFDFWCKCKELGVDVSRERSKPAIHSLRVCVCHGKP